MANEITKVTDKNNVDHPLRDAAAQTALTGILNGQSIDSFGDVESAVKANTQLIKDTVGWLEKNESQINNYIGVSGVDVVNDGIVNTVIDSGITYFKLFVRFKDANNNVISTISDTTYNTTGHKEKAIAIPNGTKIIVFGHYVSVEYLLVSFPFDGVSGDYVLSFDLDGYNPSAVGGLVVKNVKFVHTTVDKQIEDLKNALSALNVEHTGTASSTGVRKQQITINNVSYDVDGSAYMEQSVTLSTSQTTDVVFTNAIIADGTELTFSSSIWDLVPDDMVTTTGVCTVTLPKWSSAVTIGCRLRVR